MFVFVGRMYNRQRQPSNCNKTMANEGQARNAKQTPAYNLSVFCQKHDEGHINDS